MKYWHFYLYNYWPPFLGAGIHIDFVASDFKTVRVRLKRRPWTNNLVGTQFGGSIFAMTDPFYMAMLIQVLGKDFVVWDKSTKISFLKPGRTTLYAEFTLKDEEIIEIRDTASKQGKLEKVFIASVFDEAKGKIAEVEKTLWIKKK